MRCATRVCTNIVHAPWWKSNISHPVRYLKSPIRSLKIFNLMRVQGVCATRSACAPRVDAGATANPLARWPRKLFARRLPHKDAALAPRSAMGASGACCWSRKSDAAPPTTDKSVYVVCFRKVQSERVPSLAMHVSGGYRCKCKSKPRPSATQPARTDRVATRANESGRTTPGL